MQANKAVVIYHANCMDGFGSAWAFHILKEKDYPNGVNYFGANYGDVIPAWNNEPCDLYILDFSFSRNRVWNQSPYWNKITILDHHKTAQADLENWPDKPENVEIVFDMNRSGAGITWDYFCDDAERPKLIQYIEDRDLWKFKLPWSKEINAFIANHDKTFDDYQFVHERLQYSSGDFEDSHLIGHHLLRQHQRICEDIVKDATSLTINSPEGPKLGLICNCTRHFASDVGNILARQCINGFGATYHSDGTGKTKFSLRSIGEYDVSEIAKAFGGGGHKNAAGFSLQVGGYDQGTGITL